MADETIGRADYELRARIDQLKKDLQGAEAELKASGGRSEADYTVRASKWGPIMAAGVRTGIKVVGAATTAMLAIAAKGGDELIAIQNDYQSATGSSAEEAKRAGKVINQAAGENQLALKSVSDAAIAVHNDLGKTGDEADDLTKRFATFGRVTRQEPVAAVKAFDDILDAWNLQASDSQKIMDTLVVSHQRYGGAVDADQQALAALAPALRAMNGTWEDGIALIDLAKASGLDATDMIAGLTKALGKVKSPAELQRLIDDISATEDPFLRAQKAADLFGQKAGPKLANALAGKTLDDFRIDMNDVTGATVKAADALDQGFGAQARKKLSEWGADLRGLGADWGPVLTGAAGFATVISTLGLDELAKRFGPQFVQIMKSAGTAGGEALIDAAGTATGAAGTIFGNVISDPIAAALDPERNSLLGRLVRKAGAKIAAVYLAAEIFASTVSQTVAAAWDRVAASSIVMKAAGMAGTKAGLAFSAAAAIAIPAALINIHGTLSTELEKGYNSSFEEAAGKLISGGDTAGMLALRAALQAQLDKVNAGVDPLKGPFGGGTDTAAIGRAIDALSQAVGKSAPVLRDAWWQEMQLVGTSTGPALAKGIATSAPKAIAEAYARSREAGAKTIRGMIEAIMEGKADLVAAWRAALDERNTAANAADQIIINRAEITAQKKILADKKSTAAEKAEARIRLRNLRADNDALLVQQTQYGTRSQQIAKTKALLTSSALLKGLKSKDPEVKQHWIDVKEKAEKQLAKLRAAGTTYGRGFTQNFAAGLVKDIDRVGENARAISRVVKKYLQVNSPSELGSFSEQGGPEGWSRRWMALYTKGLAAGVPGINSILGGIQRFAAGPANLAAVAGGMAGGSSSTTTHHAGTLNGASFTVHLHGVGSDVSPARAERFGRDVLREVGRGFREGAARQGFTSTVTP